MFNIIISNLSFKNSSKDSKRYIKQLSIFTVIFLSHSFQLEYDSTTSTLTISASTDFEDASYKEYKSTTKSVIIDSGITEIPGYAFQNWYSLVSASIGDTVETIAQYSFYGTSLQEITIPSSVTSILIQAFTNCKYLQSIKVSEENLYYSDVDGVLCDKDVTNIICCPGGYKSTTYETPETVTSITSSGFYSCNYIVTIIISEGVTEIQSAAFYQCMSLKSFTFPSTITTIGSSLFDQCYYLETVTIDINAPLQTISSSAFQQCALKSFTIPNSVTTISSSAFQSCGDLEVIIIGEKVEVIKSKAFYYCDSLKCIYFYGNTMPEIDDTAFDQVSVEAVMTLDSYQSTTFGDFSVLRTSVLDGCPAWPTATTNTFTKSNAFTQSNTFTKSNAFTQSNTYTKSNAFTQSNTYTKSNTFTQSNTYTKSNTFTAPHIDISITSDSTPFTEQSLFTKSQIHTDTNTFIHSHNNDATLTNTIIMTYSLTFTQTISVLDIIRSKYSTVSISGDMSTYVQKEIIRYEYTVVVYSFIVSSYTNFFYIYDMNEAPTNDSNNTTTVVIVCVIVAVVVVAVVIGLVIFIRIRNRKQISEEDKSSFEQSNFGTTDTFDVGLANPNIEEDPFANDFKEEKFNQI